MEVNVTSACFTTPLDGVLYCTCNTWDKKKKCLSVVYIEFSGGWYFAGFECLNLSDFAGRKYYQWWKGWKLSFVFSANKSFESALFSYLIKYLVLKSFFVVKKLAHFQLLLDYEQVRRTHYFKWNSSIDLSCFKSLLVSLLFVLAERSTVINSL